MASLRIDILTLFPEMFAGVLGSSILKRAAADLPTRPAPLSFHLHNIRDYTADKKHGKVDAPPFGGGPGMVMQCQPVWDALMAVEAMDNRPATRILMTPQGRPLSQSLVEHLAAQPRLLLIAGHYEGLDERVVQKLAAMEVSIGDYVLSGGELPAMVLVDAVARLVPGVLGHEQSNQMESFSSHSGGLLDYPHYTKPRQWMDMEVPPVLLGGNHAAIEAWRHKQSLARTAQRRADLLAQPRDASTIALPAMATPPLIRPATLADLPALLQVHRQAFGQSGEAARVERLLAREGFNVSLLAQTQGQVVGHILLSAVTIQGPEASYPATALASVGVLPAWQGRGIGSALIRAAGDACRNQGESIVIVLGHPRYYQRFGFMPAQPLGIGCELDVPAEAFMVMPLHDDALAGVSGVVRFPPDFMSFESSCA